MNGFVSNRKGDLWSMTNCRGSWVVGGGRGSWVWVWVKVVGIKKSRGYQKNPPPKKKINK